MVIPDTRRRVIILTAILLAVSTGCFQTGASRPLQDHKVNPSLTPAEQEELAPRRWVGIGWHTLAVFGDALAEPILRRLPETDDSFAAVFDFAVTPDGRIWYPLSRFDMTGNKLVRINPLDPNESTLVIQLGDDAPSPFNVIADDRWLYVLSKYSLTESQLMRISLSDTSVREKLTLPADGGGLGTVMAFANSEQPKLLGIRLFEALAVVDPSSFTVVGVSDKPGLGGQIRFSKKLRSFVRLSRSVYLFEMTGNSILTRRVEPHLPALEHLDKFGWFPSSGEFDLDRTGELAVTLIGLGDKLAVLDLKTLDWTSIREHPRRVLGNVVNLGDDRFAIGGNIVYDLKSDELIIPKGTVITSCTQIKPLPVRAEYAE